MYTQLLTPTERTITVEIPEEYLNRPVEIMVVPAPAQSAEQRRQEIAVFFAKHQVDLSLFRFDRNELYEQ